MKIRGTTDGISDSDWDYALELAAKLSDVDEVSEQEAVYETEFMAYLDKLEGEYGPLPTILATRADFTLDYARKEELLTRAYTAALEIGSRNLVDISHSFAQLYVNELIDVERGRRWLDQLDTHLHDFPDSAYAEDAHAFRQRLEELSPPNKA